ncbi:MAG: branched-chain amino acid ABC transporter ATP-binding protein/permease [Spirochaetes bacterium]|nr:branched-chain amino acid ABC transporter ATP-binding protein/permease [Spirochaetota bacterium]
MAYLEAILINVAIYAIATLGLAIFTGYTGLFSLGHAAFMAVGAYAASILTYFYKVPFILALLVGVVLSVLVSFLIGYPTLRARLRSDYFAIATLGFGEAVKVILENFDLTQGARGLPGIQKVSTLGNTFLLLVLAVILCRNFLHTTYGRKIIAIGQDPVAAEMIGIPLLPNQLLSLGISAGLAGLSGGLLAHYTTFIQPSIFSMDLSSLITAGVVCGGMGSLTGPITAVALFVIIPELFRGFALWRLVFYGMLLVIIINWRPKGLFGYEELNRKNLPKLFSILGITVGLSLFMPTYRWVIESRGYEIFALFVAVITVGGITVLFDLLGKGLSLALAPVSVRYHALRSQLSNHLAGTQEGEVQTCVFQEPRVENEHKKAILEVKELRKNFGGVVAVDGLSFEVQEGELLGLIGPNGSGKTTVFNLISSVYPVDGGTILFRSEDITEWGPTEVVGAGIARTFQNIRLFGSMTVLENVQAALHREGTYSLVEGFLRWPKSVPKVERRLRDESLYLLSIVGLEKESDRRASTLPYGLQRKLEIARALALRPRVLLLDEPAAGMNPREASELVELIQRIHKDKGLSIILIEHHMDVVMSLCRRILVLNFGRLIAEGTPEQVQKDPLVLQAYLGEKAYAVVR